MTNTQYNETNPSFNFEFSIFNYHGGAARGIVQENVRKAAESLKKKQIPLVYAQNLVSSQQKEKLC